MKAPAVQEPARWNTRRWLLVLSLIFVLEVSLVHVLSWRPAATLPPIPRHTAFRLVQDPALSQRLGDLVWLPDPAQFATVNPHGFTAALWRDTPPVTVPPPDAGAAPEWLDEPFTVAGRAAAFSLRAPLPRLLVATPLRPQRLGLRAEGPALAPKSLLSVAGDLRGRRVLRVPELPVWPLEDILRPSVVQVLVNGAGDVLSATLQPPGSGLKAADTRALALAQAVLFAPDPVPPGRLTWGRLLFRWASVPPSNATTNRTGVATNRPPAGAAPTTPAP